jgi:hypothetical protein
MSAEGNIYKNEGNKAFSKGKYHSAIEAFTKAIACNPDEAVYYSNRSAAYEKVGDYQRALKDANKTVELKRGWAKGWGRKAIAHFKLGELSQAIIAFREALDLEPENAQFKQHIQEAEALLRDVGKKFQKECPHCKGPMIDGKSGDYLIRIIEDNSSSSSPEVGSELLYVMNISKQDPSIEHVTKIMMDAMKETPSFKPATQPDPSHEHIYCMHCGKSYSGQFVFDVDVTPCSSEKAQTIFVEVHNLSSGVSVYRQMGKDGIISVTKKKDLSSLLNLWKKFNTDTDANFGYNEWRIVAALPQIRDYLKAPIQRFWVQQNGVYRQDYYAAKHFQISKLGADEIAHKYRTHCPNCTEAKSLYVKSKCEEEYYCSVVCRQEHIEVHKASCWLCKLSN